MLVDNDGHVAWPRRGIVCANESLSFGKDISFNSDVNPEEASYNLINLCSSQNTQATNYPETRNYGSQAFTNKEIDRELDLHYFGARYYHADRPRFISPDPLSGNPEIPLSWNRYLYCRNDPVN